jgi:tetratricopeptide (TPR) repeat protein
VNNDVRSNRLDTAQLHTSRGQIVSWMALAGVILAVSGATGTWLEFPLTGSIRAIGLQGPLDAEPFYSLSAWLIVLIALTVAAWLLNWRTALIVCGLAFLGVTGYFYLTLVAGHEGWLVRFVDESRQRALLEKFIGDHYWQNLNPEPTLRLVSEFEYLPDRMGTAWAATGTGMVHTLLAGALVVGAVAASGRVYAAMAVAGSGLVVLTLLTLANSLTEADLYQRQGDTHLAAGEPRSALEAYEFALDADPVLSTSRAFLVKASYAYMGLLGQSSDLAAVYLADARRTGALQRQLSDRIRSRLSDAHRRLQRAAAGLASQAPLATAGGATIPAPATATTDPDLLRFTGPNALHGFELGFPLSKRGGHSEGSTATARPIGSLERAIRAFANQLDAELWIMQGVMALNTSAPSEARQAFQRAVIMDPTALDARFLLGHTELLLGMQQQAITSLSNTMSAIKQASIRADIASTLGDALSADRQLNAARTEYRRSLELDNVFNIRAVRSLGGT